MPTNETVLDKEQNTEGLLMQWHRRGLFKARYLDPVTVFYYRDFLLCHMTDVVLVIIAYRLFK